MKKLDMIKVFTAFSGYDIQCMALDRLSVKYKLVGWSEIDKYAIQAHNAVYPGSKGLNCGDISKIEWSRIEDFDLFTYSFPCTDISLAGARKGFTKGSGTRSSLLWECEKAIKEKKPKYLLMENVKQLVGKENMGHFKEWMYLLSELGYINYAFVLNARDFGIPQNRERVYMVSILGNEWFEIPKKINSNIKLVDVLEKNIEDKYYLSDKAVQGFARRSKRQENKTGQRKFSLEQKDYCNCITARYRNSYYDTFIVDVNTKKGYDVMIDGDSLNLAYPTSKTRRGRIGKQVSQTLLTSTNQAVFTKNKVRRLTPRECFRLMGVKDCDVDKIQKSGISDTQQYKLAGNSIVVDVLVEIFRNLNL